MTVLGTARLVCYGLVILLSITVLGLAAHSLHIVNQAAIPAYDHFIGLAIAVSIITLLTLIPVLITERIRQNFFVSWTIVELGWLGVLWVLWLASAATSSSSNAPLRTICYGPSTGPVTALQIFAALLNITLAAALSFCHQLETLVGLSWVIWILLTGILVWILGFAIRAHSAGHRGIWQASASQMSGGVGPAPQSTYSMGKHDQGISSSGQAREGV